MIIRLQTHQLFKLTLVQVLCYMLFPIFSSGQTCTMMIDQDFNHWGNKAYTVADAKSDFNNKVKPWTASTYRGLIAPGAAASLIGDVAQETRIVNGELRAEYTKNDAGGYAGGFLFDPYFDGVEEAYLEYKVKFDENFFWATGGKLPGLGGSSSGVDSETSGRGTIPSGCKYNTNGWSARLMWRRNRAQTTNPYLILYSYFAEREDGVKRVDGDCGDAKRVYSNLNDNTWYTIRQYIKLNTPGQNDGIVTMWVNGEQTYHNTKEMIRNAGKGNLKINALIMNTYRGGSRTDPVWHSPRDEYAFFDDFKVWTGCSNPPNGTVNTPPTGSFEAPTFDTIEEGYDELYVKVDASDPDGDAITLTLKIDGVDHRGTPESGAPYEWGHATSPKLDETLNLTPGVHEFEVVITDSKGASTSIKKYITVTEVKATYLGSPLDLPGVIELENYDKGGEGISYHDTHIENKGGLYRNDGVDIDNGNDGLVLGWVSTGEWLEYTVNVVSTGSYNFEFFTSSLGNGTFNLSSNNEIVIPSTSVPSTDSWDVYTSYIVTADLTAGEQVLRFNIETGGFNIDKIIVTPVVNEAPTVEITSPLDGDFFFVGDEIVLKANAEDDNQVTKVNFKVNGAYHSQDLTPNGIEYTTTFTPTEAGTYIIGARAFDADGESTEVSISIIVNLITSLDEKENSDFAVYPNPTNGFVYLNKEGSWELFNLQGALLVTGTSAQIDLTDYSSGVYFLKIGDNVRRVILE